jgi:hypothetical protein
MGRISFESSPSSAAWMRPVPFARGRRLNAGRGRQSLFCERPQTLGDRGALPIAALRGSAGGSDSPARPIECGVLLAHSTTHDIYRARSRSIAGEVTSPKGTLLRGTEKGASLTGKTTAGMLG